MTPHAILTGDIMASRRLNASQLTGTFQEMNTFWSEFSSLHSGQVLGKIDVFRGDGWQAALASPEHAVDAAVFLRAVVKACPLSEKSDSRLGIGIGSVEQLDPDDLGGSHGEAFEASGDALSLATRGKIRWMLLPDHAVLREINTLALPSLDLAISEWSAAESIAVIGEMLNWKQEQTAAHPWSQKKDGSAPTQQAVADALSRVCWKTHILPVLHSSRSFLGCYTNTSSVTCNK